MIVAFFAFARAYYHQSLLVKYIGLVYEPICYHVPFAIEKIRLKVIVKANYSWYLKNCQKMLLIQ